MAEAVPLCPGGKFQPVGQFHVTPADISECVFFHSPLLQWELCIACHCHDGTLHNFLSTSNLLKRCVMIKGADFLNFNSIEKIVQINEQTKWLVSYLLHMMTVLIRDWIYIQQA